MSQQAEPQPTIDLDELQKLQRRYLDKLCEDSEKNNDNELFRTRYSLLHPGKIDWYVFSQLLFLFFIAVIVVAFIYIIIDYLNSADVFIQKCEQHNVMLSIALYHYYMPRLLSVFDSLLTVFVILPGVLLINLLINRKETVLLACVGIRRVRAAYVIFISAIVLVILFTWCREFVLPAQRSIIGSDVTSFFEQDKTRVESKTDPMTSIYITGESLDLSKRTIIKPVFNMPVMFLNDYGQNISAQTAVWKEEQLGSDAKVTRQAGYLLKNVSADKNLDDQPSLFVNNKEIVITPLNHSWLKKGECFIVSGIEVEDLALNSELMVYSSIPELRRIMERMSENQRRDAAIILHKRIVRPFVDLCVIFVGLSFILANDNRILLIWLKTAIWWGASWILINMSSALASEIDQLLTPAIAAWIPLICFSAMSAYVWDKVYY